MRKFKKSMAVILAVLMLLTALPFASSGITPGSTVNVTGTGSWVSGFYYNFNGNFGTAYNICKNLRL